MNFLEDSNPEKDLNERVFSLVGATMPKTIKKRKVEDIIKEWIPDIIFSKSENYLKINPKVVHKPFNVQSLSEEECRLFVF